MFRQTFFCAMGATTLATLLLVEDEPSLRELVGDVLTEFGHQTTVAEDGAIALRHLDGDGFDVVITDVNLPGDVSGIELAQHVQQRHPHTRVILVSGHTRAQLPPLPDRVAFLAKPYRVQQLLDLVSGA